MKGIFSVRSVSGLKLGVLSNPILPLPGEKRRTPGEARRKRGDGDRRRGENRRGERPRRPGDRKRRDPEADGERVDSDVEGVAVLPVRDVEEPRVDLLEASGDPSAPRADEPRAGKGEEEEPSLLRVALERLDRESAGS